MKESYLTYLEDAGYTEYNKWHKRKKLAKYRCICGIEKILAIVDVKRCTTKSCGCMRYILSAKGSTTHGLKKHPLYNIWIGIRQRCLNPESPNYFLYGGAGVTICEEWNDFKIFYDWCIKNGWQKGLEVDKDKKAAEMGIPAIIYSPEMCSILSHRDNCLHRKNKRLITYNDETKTLVEWANYYKISRKLLSDRLKAGWDMHKAITYPIDKRKGVRLRRSAEIRYAFGFIG